MSQQQNPNSASNGGLLSESPPPYTENQILLPNVRPSSTSSSAQAVIQESVVRLTQSISELLALTYDGHMKEQDREDGKVLLCLSSHAADFLADVSRRLSSFLNVRQGAPVKRFEAELYLIPEHAFTESGWYPSGAEDRARQGVHLREARVKLPDQEKAPEMESMNDGFQSKMLEEKSFSNCGEFMAPGYNFETFQFHAAGAPDQLWWDSEFQAHRFAQYLGAEFGEFPMSPTTSSNLRNFPAFLSRRDINREVNGDAASSRSSNGAGKSTVTAAGSVRITTKAEKMTFRRENEMGLWESTSGWIIILNLAITW